KLAAQEVEQHAAGEFTVRRACVCEDRVRVPPLLLRSAELTERQVIDIEQPALFQIGRRDPPPASKIAIDVVAEYFAERAFRFFASSVLDSGVGSVEREIQIERFEGA